MSRNSLAATTAIIFVAAAIGFGFWNLGTPARERQIHQDVRTAQGVRALATKITATWETTKTMPVDLEHVVPAYLTKDPTTHQMFTYHRKEGTAYELCAIFLTSDLNDRESETPFWRHGKGSYCFELDTSQDPPPPPASITY